VAGTRFDLDHVTDLGGHTMTRSRIGLAAVALCAGTSTSAFAADVTWDNGSANSQWDTSSLNWTGAAWNNAGGDGAVFGAAGVGAIDVTGPVNVNSLNFGTDGYLLTGAGSLNIVNGISTQTTGVVNVATGATAKINVPINSSLGFQKIGEGVLELSAPCTFGGGIPLVDNGLLRADLIVGGTTGPLPSGRLRIMNSGVVPASTRASVAQGLLDIGGNNVTLSALTFVNQTNVTAWDPVAQAAGSGVIGSGTLRVTGEINVIGVTGGNQSSNTISANLDMGGGTQVVRVGVNSSFGLSSALQFVGSISNGSLFKSIGVTQAGVQGSVDGMGLFGNNTYTGATLLNSGPSVITGTNATTSLKIGGQGGPVGSSVTLQGANGSLGSATQILAFGAGIFAIDNNAAIGTSAGSSQPAIPAANNGDRVRDDAEIRLRDGGLLYRGLTAAASSETFGSLNVLGGQNTVTLAPTGTGGTVALTVAGNLSMAPRATMTVSTTTLGAASKMFINGSMPAADATGILPRMAGSSDFLTYNGTTGLTPYTGYATDFSTAGTNVAVTAASTVSSSVNINALKRTGTFTTTIGAGQTLGVTSGMMLNTSGTGTFTGGTIAFGSNPGVFFGGTNTISSAVTGSAGLINASSTTTLSGDLSGLSGTITNNGGTLTLSTNTFAGDLELRNGTLNLNTSQTLAGQGAVRIGVPQNDSNMTGTIPSLSFSGAGANAVIGRDIISDAGTTDVAGAELGFSLIPSLSPLSNATGSQTLSGNITLNTPLRLQGGGAGGSGSTNFTGNVSGPSFFNIPNGRANFSGNVSNAGGFVIGRQGFTAQITFSGTGSGNGPIRFSGGNNMQFKYMNGSLPGGQISIVNAGNTTPVNIFPLNNSSISNAMAILGDAVANVGAGITAEWAGPISGANPITKTGTGTLILSNAGNTYGGNVLVTGGTLRVNGSLPAALVNVSSGALLGGTGVITGNTSVASGGTIGAGNSIGTLTTGNLNVGGVIDQEIDMNNGGPALADLINVVGSVNVSNATLNLSVSNAPGIGSFGIGRYIVVSNDSSDAVVGNFAAITGVLPSGYSVQTIDYAFSGLDDAGRSGDGNDIAVFVVPAPSSVVMLGAMVAPVLRRRR